MKPPADRQLGLSGGLATTLGGVSAAVSLYWLVGGTALLDTVGGSIERLGRERSTASLVGLALVVAVKAGVTGISAVRIPTVRTLLGVHVRDFADHRLVRLCGWVAAAILILYGLILTVVGLAVVADVIDNSQVTDMHALTWHALFWDPWFLLWGLALKDTMRRSRSSPAEHGGAVPVPSTTIGR